MEKKYTATIAVLAILTIIFCGTTGYFYISYTGSKNDYQTLSDDYGTLNTWLNGNKTLLQAIVNERNQLQTWLDGNKTLLQETIAERDQLQSWLGGNITSYESQIQNLNTQIDSLNAEIIGLQSQIDTLDTQIEQLNSTIDSLRKAELGGYLNSTYTYLLLDDEHHVQGIIINYGTDSATGVYVDMAWSVETGSHSETLPLPDIAGRSYVIVDKTYKFDLTDFPEEPEFQHMIHWDQKI